MKGQYTTFQRKSESHVIETSIDLANLETSVATDQTTLMEAKSAQPSILIVDDDPINLQVLQSILSVEQYEITIATSGKEALEKLDGKEFSLVISDIMMPQMSGYELTKKIRNRYSPTELPILLLTARSEPNNIQAGF